MARSKSTRRSRVNKDSTEKSVAFFNDLSWNSGGENNDESTPPRKHQEPQHADPTSRKRKSSSNKRPNVFEVPDSQEPKTRRSLRSKRASMKQGSINGSSSPFEADGSEEEEDEEEQEENHDAMVKEELGEENEVGRGGDEDAENEGNQADSASDSDSSDSDSPMSESAKQLADDNNRRINNEIEVPMPPLGHFGDRPSKESNGADDGSQSADDSGESDNSQSDDDKSSGEENQRSEEIEPQNDSDSEYNDSESEQADSEQETYETPPQQLGSNNSGSENRTDGATLRGNSRSTNVAQQSQAGQLSLRPTVNHKRKERPSFDERISKSPRVDRQSSHSDSADPSGHGYVQWEYDMEAEDQTQHDTTADADDLLFEEAIQLLGLQRSWKHLMSGCHELRTREVDVRPVFLGIESLREHIFKMQELYKQMQEDRRTGIISVELKDDLQKEWRLVREKAIAVLTKLVNRANTAHDTKDYDMKEEASTLAQLIILEVVTELGDLAKECLKAYYSEYTLAEGGFIALLEILETMRLLDGKIYSLRSCYRIDMLDYGRDLRSALSTLWKRLDQGEFYARQQKQKPQRPAPKPRPWTDAQEMAVIERLQQYYDQEDRFRCVAEDYADEVGGRTEDEIRKKARELYNDYLQAKNISLTWLLSG